MRKKSRVAPVRSKARPMVAVEGTNTTDSVLTSSTPSTIDPHTGNFVSNSRGEDADSNGDDVVVVENGDQSKEVNQNPPKRKKSPVWEDFNDITVNGVRKAKCKHCGQEMSMSATSPTTQLHRHLDRCTLFHIHNSGKKESGPKQSVLSFDAIVGGGNLTTYKYDNEKVLEMLAKMIIVHEYPFRMVEHELFILFCKLLNPYFEEVKRLTITKKCIAVYETEKIKLKATFASVGRISLTSDLWTSNQTIGYLVLTAHYVDTNWILQKRILNFCCLPPPHTGVAIAEKISECISDWGIRSKVSTITFDNATSNDVAIRILKEEFAIRGNLYFGGQIFHVRCGAHILNILVQEGLTVIKEAILCVRESVKYITLTPSREDKWNGIVKDLNLPSGKSLIVDCGTRWNSTFDMLKRALIFKDVFPLYRARDALYTWLPNDEDWERASEICKFLEIFQEATNLFSGVTYSTSNLYFPEIWKIRKMLDERSNDSRDYIALMVIKMRDKFDKYWGDFNLLMAIGAAMDLRNKMRYLEFAFKKIYPPEKHPLEEGQTKERYEKEIDDVNEALRTLYADYVSQENAGHKENEGRSSTNTCTYDDGKQNEKKRSRSEFEMWAKDMNIAQPGKNELDVYLEEGIYIGEDDGFSALCWWKVNVLKFPTLSKMARDILTIPITSVASESAFSVGRRVIDDFRSSLLPSTVEALITSGDWLRNEYGIGIKFKIVLKNGLDFMRHFEHFAQKCFVPDWRLDGCSIRVDDEYYRFLMIGALYT